MTIRNWQCPYCNEHATISKNEYSTDNHVFRNSNNYLNRAVRLDSTIIICPNKNCKQITIHTKFSEIGASDTFYTIQNRRLLPEGIAKSVPEYVPNVIKEDYTEACAIMEIAPKFSATASRRCLQGMIRNFHGIKKGRLIDEINALKDVVEEEVWEALDAIRNLGNIGAHPEKDVNVVVEIEPGEAELLIEVIEMLIEDWYVERHKRQERLGKVKNLAASKKEAKKQKAS